MSQIVVTKLSKKCLKYLVAAAEALDFKYSEYAGGFNVIIPHCEYSPTVSFEHAGAESEFNRDAFLDWNVRKDDHGLANTKATREYNSLLALHNRYAMEQVARDNYWEYEVSETNPEVYEIHVNIQ